MPIANARMYSATPAVKQAWKEVLGWALRRAGLQWELVDHDAPAPLSTLWARGDLGLAMMCGLPYSRRHPRPQLVAAPMPSSERYGGRAIYFTDIVVRADSPHRSLEDTFGGIVGYTLEDSMSGYVALRRHLMAFRGGRRSLYRKAVGGLVNARMVIEALAAGEIDVGPLDSYYHDLLRRNDPAFAATVRAVATTAAAPIPPLVATAHLESSQMGPLQDALREVGRAAELAAQCETLLLKGFAVPLAADYDVLGDALAAAREHPELW